MKNLKTLREKIGMTQKELAKKVGIERAYVSMIETNENRSISKSLTKKFCSIFNVKEYQLLGKSNLVFKPKDNKELEEFIKILREEYKCENQRQN